MAQERAKAEAKAQRKADQVRTAEKVEFNEMNKAGLSGLVSQEATVAAPAKGVKHFWKKYQHFICKAYF